jgi:enoyl-[acyl-carrier-protein] reductase (NADH)
MFYKGGTMLVTKREVQLKRSFGTITFNAGSTVKEVGGIYYIAVKDAFLNQELLQYGGQVEFDNVYSTDIFVRTEHSIRQISEEVFIELNKYNHVHGCVKEYYASQIGTRFLEMKEEDFVKALMYSIEKSYEYGCINNELLDAEVLNSIKLKEYNVDDKN